MNASSTAVKPATTLSPFAVVAGEANLKQIWKAGARGKSSRWKSWAAKEEILLANGEQAAKYQGFSNSKNWRKEVAVVGGQSSEVLVLKNPRVWTPVKKSNKKIPAGVASLADSINSPTATAENQNCNENPMVPDTPTPKPKPKSAKPSRNPSIFPAIATPAKPGAHNPPSTSPSSSHSSAPLFESSTSPKRKGSHIRFADERASRVPSETNDARAVDDTHVGECGDGPGGRQGGVGQGLGQLGQKHYGTKNKAVRFVPAPIPPRTASSAADPESDDEEVKSYLHEQSVQQQLVDMYKVGLTRVDRFLLQRQQEALRAIDCLGTGLKEIRHLMEANEARMRRWEERQRYHPYPRQTSSRSASSRSSRPGASTSNQKNKNKARNHLDHHSPGGPKQSRFS